MAAYRSSNTATVESGTSVTVTKPTGLADGDLMVAFCSENNTGGDFSTPSGWALVDEHEQSGSGNSFKVKVFAKVADSTDAAASDFTFSYTGTNTKLEAVLYAISGTFTSSGNIYAISSQGGTEAVTDTFRCTTGITPVAANSLIIMYFYLSSVDSDNNNFSNYAIETSSPTWTERHDIQDAGGSNTIRIGTATATRTETTPTGYFQAEVGTGDLGGGVAFSIGILLAITDTQNGTATPAVISLVGSLPAPTPSGAANVTIGAAVSLASSVVTPTATTGDPLWKNTDKPSASSFTNTDKL